MVNENIKQLVIKGKDLDEVYFIDGIVSDVLGVFDIEIDEDILEVTVDYDSNIVTRDFLLHCIDYAQQDIVMFYMELINAGLDLPSQNVEELIKSLK